MELMLSIASHEVYVIDCFVDHDRLVGVTLL